MAWTDERVKTAKTMWEQGKPASLIASRIGVSRNAVIGKMTRMGVSTPATQKPLRWGLKSNQPHFQRKPVSRVKPAPRRQPAPPRVPDYRLLPTPQDTGTVRVTSVADLEPHHCRFIPGEPGTGYCGDTVHPGLSYCAHHATRCYEPPTPRRINERERSANVFHRSTKIGIPEPEIFETA